MSGQKLRKLEERGSAGQSLLPEAPQVPSARRRQAVLGSFMCSALAGTLVLANGTNIKNLGGDIAMAQTATPRTRDAEHEDKPFLQALAVEAGKAFKDYLLTGDSKRRNDFNTIYSRKFNSRPLSDNGVFMDKLFKEVDAVREDPKIKPIAEAFAADEGRLFGI